MILRFSGIDLFPPCLWKSVTGYCCPGCGITGAALKLIELDISGAWGQNPLVFLILQVFIFETVKIILDTKGKRY